MRFFPFITAIVILGSCCKQEISDNVLSYFEDAPSVVATVESVIKLDQYGVLVPTKLIHYKGSFIIRKGLAENFVDILTPEKKVIACVKKGRGPGELVDVGSFQMRGDSLFIYGPSQKKLMVLDIPGSIASQKQITLEEYQIGSPDQKVSDQMILPVCLQYYNGHYYGSGFFGEGSLYAELSKDGMRAFGIPGPTLEDHRISSLDRAALNMDAQLSLSPDGTRIAAAYTQIAAISFGCTCPVLREQWSKVFYQPKLWFPDQSGLMASYEKENYATFQGLQAFNDCVYALYSGKNRVGDNENLANHCNHLLVFDWTGAPLCHYVLEEPIAAFWIEENELYGISFSPETKLYQFKQVKPVPRVEQ